MEEMKIAKSLKPTKWKVILSLAPFVFPLFQIFGELETRFSFLPIEFGIALEIPLTLSVYIETYTAAPFGFLLKPLGWWSNNTPLLFPDGPLLPGSIAVAITYSILLYLILSAIKIRQKKQP